MSSETGIASNGVTVTFKEPEGEGDSDGPWEVITVNGTGTGSCAIRVEVIMTGTPENQVRVQAQVQNDMVIMPGTAPQSPPAEKVLDKSATVSNEWGKTINVESDVDGGTVTPLPFATVVVWPGRQPDEMEPIEWLAAHTHYIKVHELNS